MIIGSINVYYLGMFLLCVVKKIPNKYLWEAGWKAKGMCLLYCLETYNNSQAIIVFVWLLVAHLTDKNDQATGTLFAWWKLDPTSLFFTCFRFIFCRD